MSIFFTNLQPNLINRHCHMPLMIEDDWKSSQQKLQFLKSPDHSAVTTLYKGLVTNNPVPILIKLIKILLNT